MYRSGETPVQLNTLNVFLPCMQCVCNVYYYQKSNDLVEHIATTIRKLSDLNESIFTIGSFSLH